MPLSSLSCILSKICPPSFLHELRVSYFCYRHPGFVDALTYNTSGIGGGFRKERERVQELLDKEGPYPVQQKPWRKSPICKYELLLYGRFIKVIAGVANLVKRMVCLGTCGQVLLPRFHCVDPVVLLQMMGAFGKGKSVRLEEMIHMMDDQDLGFFANFLGVFIFVLVIAYHFVVADPKFEGN
ncbi:hypothetical protein RJT34_21992 [Clitoria ternatea]|uniref:Dolichyl-diphosphooligosaccharide--protein glycosyltransferase subunit 4 n=1 Tax=Clitoria ternatea TaxID=43366 RepID=A0AAN9IUT7_CLITE